MNKVTTMLLVFLMIFTAATQASGGAAPGETGEGSDESAQIGFEKARTFHLAAAGGAVLISEPAFTRENSTAEVSNLATVSLLQITVPAEAAQDIAEEGAELSVLAVLFEKDKITDGNVCDIMAAGTRRILPGEREDIKIMLDLSEYTVAQKRNLYVKVMVWNNYSAMEPYLIPAFEKFK